MSKHDLKGIDTSKVGKNKDVAYTFEDYKRDFGLSDKGAIRDLKAQNVLLSDLEAIAPTIEQPKTVGGRVAQFLGAGPGFTGKTELIGDKVVGVERPRGILGTGRLTAGLADFATFGLTDFDKRGNLFGGTHSLSGYGGGQQLNYKLPKAITDAIEADKKKSEVDEGSKDPLSIENLDKLLDYELKYKKATDAMDRKGRAADVAMEMAAYRAQMPFITRQMKDLSTFKQRQLLDAERIKQSLPNAVQSRLATADAGFATQAGAIAGQQDAATRFAGLGNQRQFGQNVVYTPPLIRG